MIASLGILVTGNETLINSLRKVFQVLAKHQTQLGHIPSTLDQNPTMQQDAILKRYPDAKMLSEKKSGTTRKGREQLTTILNIIDKDERLVVWKLDRLARNMKDLLDMAS